MSKNAWSPGRISRSLKTCGMRAAALARDGVDVVDVLGAHVEQGLRDVGDQLALAHPGLQLLGQHLVGPVDHRAGGVEQDDLVDRLDLAGVEHHLLAVEDLDALLGEGREHRGLGDVDADGHVRDALVLEDPGDLLRRRPEQAGVGGHGAAQADHAGVDVLRPQPRAVEPVVLGGRAEVPDVRIAAARQQGVAGHLVARPLADVGARDVADVVEVEQQDRADLRRRERLAGASQPVGAQSVDVPALLPVDVHRTRRSEGSGHRSTPVRSNSGSADPCMRVGVFTHATQRSGRASPDGTGRSRSW